ncbi:MAG TPA: hypothetical protein VJ997_01540, partial [Longimicrobiales bacterium]|nr:hypothetical protein [Longimicrobiales bacterium]
GTYYDKQAMRLNLDQSIGSRMSLKLNMNGVHTKTGRGFTNNDNRSISYWMTFPQSPTFVDLRQRADGTWPENPFANSNPLQTAALAVNDESVWRMLGSADLQIDAIENDEHTLRLGFSGGVDFFNLKNVVYAPPELQFEPIDGKPGTSFLGQTDNLNMNLSANVVHTWQPAALGLSATTSFGMQYEQTELDVARILNEDLIVGQTNIDAGTNPGVFQNRQLVKDLGFFAQEEVLLLDERLLLTAGVRADRSSNNAATDEYFVYPKFSGSYRFVAPFPGTVDEFKIRGAWGQAGNQPVYGNKFSNLNAGNISGLQTLNISTTTVAEDLHPERQREIEGGFDATLFGRRAQLEATMYQRRITDLLLQRALPPSSGFNTAIFNGGVMTTSGYEAALQLLPIQGDVTWNSRITFSKDKSVIDELPVPPFAAGGFGTALGGFRVEEGKSTTQIVGRDTTTIADDPRCDGPCPVGTRLVTDIGDANPDFRMGFSNTFTMGNLSLYSLFDWQHGGDIINLTAWLYDLSQSSDDFADPCNISGCSGDETLGEYRLRVYPGRTSKVWVEDGSFVKLREVTLSYELPQNVAKSLWGRARSVRFSLSGRNLLTFTNYSGMDPEVSNFGAQAIGRNVDVAPYPPSRSFWLSVDIGF